MFVYFERQGLGWKNDGNVQDDVNNFKIGL